MIPPKTKPSPAKPFSFTGEGYHTLIFPCFARLVYLHATILLSWIFDSSLDCTKWCEAHGKTIDQLEKAGWNVGVAWQDGRMFHGPCAIRMNLALPLSRVQEAFDRLDKYVFNGAWV